MTFNRENWIGTRSGCVGIIVAAAVMLAFRSATATGAFPDARPQAIRPSLAAPKLIQHAEPTPIDAEPTPTTETEEATDGDFISPEQTDPTIPDLPLNDDPPKPPVELDPDLPVPEGLLAGEDEADGGVVLPLQGKEALPLQDVFRDLDAIFDDEDDVDDRPAVTSGETSSGNKKTSTSQDNWAPTAAARKLLAESSTRARISLPTVRTASYQQPQSLPSNSQINKLDFVDDRQSRSVLHQNPLRD